jgi:hypothetical protein
LTGNQQRSSPSFRPCLQTVKLKKNLLQCLTKHHTKASGTVEVQDQTFLNLKLHEDEWLVLSFGRFIPSGPSVYIKQEAARDPGSVFTLTRRKNPVFLSRIKPDSSVTLAVAGRLTGYPLSTASH